MAEIYNTISIVAFSIAGLSFCIAIFLWFKFGMFSIIGELSGRTAKKSIQQMRKANEESGKKAHYPTKLEIKKEIVTEVIEPCENDATMLLAPEEEGTMLLGAGTELLDAVMQQPEKRLNYEHFQMLQNIILIHTDETI